MMPYDRYSDIGGSILLADYRRLLTVAREIPHFPLEGAIMPVKGGTAMRFRVQIDPAAEEEILATVHQRTGLIDQIEAMVLGEESTDRMVGYTEDDWKELRFADIECVIVQEDKTYAIDSRGERYRLKARLYEVEELLPDSFLRINKSALANRERIDRFTVSFNGAVDVIFKSGYRDYVSRRCFRAIKERMGIK